MNRLWCQRNPAGHPVAVNRAVARRHSTTDVPLVHAGTYARPDEADEDVLAAVLAGHHARGSHPYDGPVVSVASRLSDPGPVRWASAGYFDLLLTNHAPETVRRPDGSLYLPYDHRHTMADTLGVAGMALTSDGWWVLCRSSTSSTACGGMLVPSGAGAVEPSDVLGATGLREAVRTAAAREVVEELALPDGAGVDVHVTGVALDLGARGKPEATFVALLDLPADAVGAGTPDAHTDGHELLRCEGDPVAGAAALLAGLPEGTAWSVTHALESLLHADWLHPALTVPVPVGLSA